MELQLVLQCKTRKWLDGFPQMVQAGNAATVEVVDIVVFALGQCVCGQATAAARAAAVAAFPSRLRRQPVLCRTADLLLDTALASCRTH